MKRPALILNGVYAALGLAATLSLLRLGLRLLAADELSPVGRGLVTIGGWAVLPFSWLFKTGPVAGLPGSSFEPAALIAAGFYLGLAILIAVTIAFYKIKLAQRTSNP